MRALRCRNSCHGVDKFEIISSEKLWLALSTAVDSFARRSQNVAHFSPLGGCQRDLQAPEISYKDRLLTKAILGKDLAPSLSCQKLKENSKVRGEDKMNKSFATITAVVLLHSAMAIAAIDNNSGEAEAKTTTLKLEADHMENQFRGVLSQKRGIALKSSDQKSYVLYCDANVMTLEFEKNRHVATVSMAVDQCHETITEIWSRLIDKGEKLKLTQGKDSFRLDGFLPN